MKIYAKILTFSGVKFPLLNFNCTGLSRVFIVYNY